MGEAGILGEDDRVELIEGEILEMSPIGRKHVSSVIRLTGILSRLVADAALVSVQNPVQLSDQSEPQPDVALLRPRPDVYADREVTAADVLLIIEVADSSEAYDRQTKAPLYARSGIPELWIVDLIRDHVALYRHPTNDGFGTTRVTRRGESISPLAFPGLTIAVNDILG